jgi:hypothetical protein
MEGLEGFCDALDSAGLVEGILSLAFRGFYQLALRVRDSRDSRGGFQSNLGSSKRNMNIFLQRRDRSTVSFVQELQHPRTKEGNIYSDRRSAKRLGFIRNPSW